MTAQGCPESHHATATNTNAAAPRGAIGTTSTRLAAFVKMVGVVVNVGGGSQAGMTPLCSWAMARRRQLDCSRQQL